MTDKVLSDIYYNTKGPASFGGLEKIHREASKKIPGIKRSEVKEWLSSQLVYTLHKPIRKKFKRNPVIVEKINENFQADLVDMREFSKQNDGYNYILTVIDVFSKKAFAISIKNKSSASIVKAIETILKNWKPFKLQTDKGTEFVNSDFKKLMEKYDIIHFTSNNSDIKCSVIERFNRTLKNKMFRYFTRSGNRKYITVLNDLISSYNNTYHRTIKMSPNDVKEDNEKIVFKNTYGVDSKRDILRKYKQPSLKTGDSVRKKYTLGPLERGYYPNWTDEVFTIDKSMKSLTNGLFRVKDSANQQLNQRFYPQEIQKVENNHFRVEKILKERKFRGKKQYFVKWLNHPSSQNSWIEATDLFDIDGQ